MRTRGADIPLEGCSKRERRIEARMTREVMSRGAIAREEPENASRTQTTATTFYFFFVSCRPSLSSSSSSLGGLKALWSVFVSVLMCFNANQKVIGLDPPAFEG
ncbi:unnamed protein product [Boreogadus saida]